MHPEDFAKFIALVFLAATSLLIVVGLAFIDYNILTSEDPSVIPELVTNRYSILAGFCVVGIAWGTWRRWTTLKNVEQSQDLSLFNRSIRALQAGILVGALIIVTTSSSAAFLLGFFVSTEKVPASAAESAAIIVIIILLITIVAAYLTASKYINDLPSSKKDLKSKETREQVSTRRSMPRFMVAVAILSVAVLLTRFISDRRQVELEVNE